MLRWVMLSVAVAGSIIGMLMNLRQVVRARRAGLRWRDPDCLLYVGGVSAGAVVPVGVAMLAMPGVAAVGGIVMVFLLLVTVYAFAKTPKLGNSDRPDPG